MTRSKSAVDHFIRPPWWHPDIDHFQGTMSFGVAFAHLAITYRDEWQGFIATEPRKQLHVAFAESDPKKPDQRHSIVGTFRYRELAPPLEIGQEYAIDIGASPIGAIQIASLTPDKSKASRASTPATYKECSLYQFFGGVEEGESAETFSSMVSSLDEIHVLICQNCKSIPQVRLAAEQPNLPSSVVCTTCKLYCIIRGHCGWLAERYSVSCSKCFSKQLRFPVGIQWCDQEGGIVSIHDEFKCLSWIWIAGHCARCNHRFIVADCEID